MKVVVYTCITGAYESVQEAQIFEGADFYLFGSQKPVYSNWKFLPAINIFTNPRRNARYHKLVPHEFFPDYDYHIWLDGSVETKVGVRYLINYLETSGADIVTFRHPVRDCIYQEAKECIRLQLDDEQVITKQVTRLRQMNYPEHNGLAETKVVIRKNTPWVTEFNREWFYQLMTGTLRDQVSFNSAVWKTKVKVAYLVPILNGETNWFTYHKHIRRNLQGQIV